MTQTLKQLTLYYFLSWHGQQPDTLEAFCVLPLMIAIRLR
jgi:hypothetical protein